MAEDLEKRLQGMQLTEEEEEIVVCDEGEDETISQQLMLCLVGKLLTSNPFSFEAMKNTMRAAWRLSKGMVVREIENKIFIFQFFNLLDKRKVMDEGLWTFDGAPLILKEVEEGIQPSELVFDSVRLWIKAEDVPLNKRAKSMAVTMEARLGKFIEYDDTDPIGWSKYMRFRADIRLDKPLRRGMRIGVANGSKWITFKYEKVIDFCYACGLLGHSYQQCLAYDGVTSADNLPYGKSLRGSPTRRKKFVDSRREEETALCNEFKGNLRLSKAKAKLTFNSGAPELNELNASKNIMTVYTNPIAGEMVDMERNKEHGGCDTVEGNGSGERFLKRVRQELANVEKGSYGAGNGPIFDTPMSENSGGVDATLFPIMDISGASRSAHVEAAAIGVDQSRRTQ